MAALTKAVAGIDSAVATNSTTLTTRLTLSAATLIAQGFEENDEVIVISWALMHNANAGTTQAWRLQYGGSTISNSTANPLFDQTSAGASFSECHPYMTRINLGGTIQDITLQNQRGGTSANTVIERARIIVLRATNTSDGLGEEGVDWFWNKSTTNVAHTTTYSGTDRASITWTPASATEDWIIICSDHIAVDSTSVNYEGRVMLDGSTLVAGDYSEEGETTSEEITHLFAGVMENLSVASHTIAYQSRDDTATAANDHRESAILLLRAGRFPETSWHTPADNGIAEDVPEIIANITSSLTSSVDALVFGSMRCDVGAADEGIWMWVAINGTAQAPLANRGGVSTRANAQPSDATDENQCTWVGVLSLSSGAQDIELWAETTSGSSGNAEEIVLLMIPLFVVDSTTPVNKDLELDWTTRALATDSNALRWNVATAIADTVELDWAVTTPAGDQVELDWGVRDLAGDEAELVWHLRAHTTDQVALEWNVASLIADTVELDWAVTTPAGDQVELDWGVRDLAQYEAGLEWDTRAAVDDSIELDWAVTTAIADQVGLGWMVTTAIADTVELEWAVRAAVDDTVQLIWSVLDTMSDQVALEWNVASALADTVDLDWAVRAAVDDTVQLIWEVLSTQAVGDNVQLIWSVRDTTTDQVALEWTVRDLAADQVDLDWAVTALATDTVELDWAVRAAVDDTVQLIWEVLSAQAVGDVVQLIWSIRAHATDQVDLVWSVRDLIADQVALEWMVTTPTGDTVELEWGVRDLAGDQVDLLWTLEAAAAALLNLRWKIAAADDAWWRPDPVGYTENPVPASRAPAGWTPAPAGHTRTPSVYEPAVREDPSPW